MAHTEVEEICMVSDISEGSSNGEVLLPKPIRGVRNGSLPPFVIKLYDLVSNKATDSIISWVRDSDLALTETQVRGGATSFTIRNEHDFISNLLPKMSKSNNFESFITQLNNYGFKKISWDRREYAHECFQEGKPHLLKNIKRRSKQNTSMGEKMTFEIKKLERESKELDLELNKFKEYVDDTISNQKRIVQVMANAIKSTFGQHHDAHCAYMSNEPENDNKG
ncbi:hypothetical protein L1887_37535 [Cichorium endivia]|nr:hypothetical protein L1887_37535 [Cichorium endivia]